VLKNVRILSPIILVTFAVSQQGRLKAGSTCAKNTGAKGTASVKHGKIGAKRNMKRRQKGKEHIKILA
jgi:hypothetical protein